MPRAATASALAGFVAPLKRCARTVRTGYVCPVTAGNEDGLSAAPSEDRGHETATWYGFQYACTAMECLELLLDPTRWVLCEWHTDFVVGSAAGTTLVSVKHRTPDQGPWRLSELTGGGGLAVLYSRWAETGGQHACRLATNAGFFHRAGDARDLQRLLETAPSEDDSALEAFAERLAEPLGAPDRATGRRFLASLRFVRVAADATAVDAVGIEHARRVLERAGHGQMSARAAYLAAVRLVREAVAGCDASGPPSTWLFAQEALQATRVSRTVTWARLREALFAAGVPVADGGPAEAAAGGDNVMGRKLRAGGLGPSALSAAPRLRQRWYAAECRYGSGLPAGADDPIEKAKASVAAHALGAEASSRAAGSQYGPQMYLELESRLRTVETEFRSIGPDDLMGCAFQLTHDCSVWWSDEFDPSTEAPWVAGARPAP